MDLMDIKKGDYLSIRDKKFQVIEVWEDIEPENDDRFYLELSLIQFDSGKITTSHSLKYYYNSNDIYFHDMIKCNEVKIKEEEIKKISS